MQTHAIDLVKALSCARPAWPNPDREWLERGDSSEVALTMMRTIERVTGAPPAYDLGSFWLWCKELRAWVEVDEDAMAGLFHSWSGIEVFAKWEEGQEGESAKVKPLKIGRASVYSEAMRQWCGSRGLGAGYFDGERRGVGFENVFLAVVEREGGGLRVEAQDVSPDHRSRASYPWPCDEARAPTCDRWLAHLRSLWTEEEVTLLGQYLGAAILGVAPHFGRALYLAGVRGSGKSTILNVVLGIVPDGAVSYVPPSDWGHEYKPAALAGSRLNLVFEADDQGALMAQAQIRQIISGEPMFVNKKYGQPFRFSPRCAHIFATNGTPVVPGAHAAFWDRFLMLKLAKTIRDTPQEVKDYHRVLLKEREGIVAWALHHVILALEAGRYTIPASVLETVDQWRIDADSVAGFVDELCEVSEGWSDTSDLYRDYVAWCERGGAKPVSVRNFSVRLREVGESRKDPVTRRAQVKLKRKLY